MVASANTSLSLNNLWTLKFWVWLAVVLLLLPSCGVKTVYNHLDLLIPWYVEDYITLNDQQQAELEKRLASVIKWHRTTQLAQYSAFMRKTSAEIHNGVTEQELDDALAEVDKSWHTLISKIAPELVDILLTANDDQKKELFDNIKKRNDEFKKDYLDLSEQQRIEDRVEAMQKNFKRWLGSLSEQQRSIIKHYASNFIPIHKDRWLFRLRWQNELRTLLNKDPAKPQVRESLEKLFIDMQAMYPPEYQQKRDVNKKLIIEMILKLGGTFNKAQLDYLFDRIESYAKTFEELSVQI